MTRCIFLYSQILSVMTPKQLVLGALLLAFGSPFKTLNIRLQVPIPILFTLLLIFLAESIGLEPIQPIG